jgi:hypothetical protein
MSMVGLHWDNFWEDGGQHGQESEEGKEGKEDSQEDGQEEKVVIRSTKPHSIRIASEVRTALRSTDRRQPSSQNIRATNSLTGPLCRWLLHKGPVFH